MKEQLLKSAKMQESHVMWKINTSNSTRPMIYKKTYDICRSISIIALIELQASNFPLMHDIDVSW